MQAPEASQETAYRRAPSPWGRIPMGLPIISLTGNLELDSLPPPSPGSSFHPPPTPSPSSHACRDRQSYRLVSRLAFASMMEMGRMAPAARPCSPHSSLPESQPGTRLKTHNPSRQPRPSLAMAFGSPLPASSSGLCRWKAACHPASFFPFPSLTKPRAGASRLCNRASKR